MGEMAVWADRVGRDKVRLEVLRQVAARVREVVGETVGAERGGHLGGGEVGKEMAQGGGVGCRAAFAPESIGGGFEGYVDPVRHGSADGWCVVNAGAVGGGDGVPKATGRVWRVRNDPVVRWGRGDGVVGCVRDDEGSGDGGGGGGGLGGGLNGWLGDGLNGRLSGGLNGWLSGWLNGGLGGELNGWLGDRLNGGLGGGLNCGLGDGLNGGLSGGLGGTGDGLRQGMRWRRARALGRRRLNEVRVRVGLGGRRWGGEVVGRWVHRWRRGEARDVAVEHFEGWRGRWVWIPGWRRELGVRRQVVLRRRELRWRELRWLVLQQVVGRRGMRRRNVGPGCGGVRVELDGGMVEGTLSGWNDGRGDGLSHWLNSRLSGRLDGGLSGGLNGGLNGGRLQFVLAHTPSSTMDMFTLSLRIALTPNESSHISFHYRTRRCLE